MKKHLFAMVLGWSYLTAHAQTAPKAKLMQDASFSSRLQVIEDQIALKNLVDTFSVLADKKDTQAQTLLFTEDATVDSYVNGQRVSALKGRQQIGAAFAAYLSNFSTVYHHNGQQTLTLAGDKATGVSYCLVTLIGDEKGQKVTTASGVIYQDEYVRANGRWLIARRTSTFAWQEKRAL